MHWIILIQQQQSMPYKLVLMPSCLILLKFWPNSCDIVDDAVEFCKDNGIVFYSVNKSFPEEKFDPKYSRKINADIFIDDRNIGGLLEWGQIYQQLIGEEKPVEKTKKRKRGWLPF